MTEKMRQSVMSSYQCILVVALLITSCVHTTRSESVTTVTQFSKKLNKFLFPSDDIASSKTPVTSLIWSPLSVYSALSVLLEGAGGQTEKELRDILEPSLKNDVNFTVTGVHNKSSSSASDGMNIATGIFISNEFKPNKVFSEKLVERQSQPDVIGSLNISQLDFSQVEKSVTEINNWVNRSTNGLISEIVQSNHLTKDSKLVLANAVQFKGTWRSRFNPAETAPRMFYGVEKNSTVDMMYQRSTQDYAKFYDEDGQTFEMLKLGYSHSDTKLIFVIPSNASFLLKLFNLLTTKVAKLSLCIERLEPTELDLYIPKLKLESDVPIKEALQQAGLNSLFSQGDCNLTRLIDVPDSNTSVPLYITDLVHKTVLNVDEDGTEAGAATASFLVPLSGLMEHRVQNLTLNKPFIVFIRQADSSAFQGIISDLPSTVIAQSEPSTVPSQPENPPKANDSTSNQPTSESPTSPTPTNKRDEKSQETAWWVPNGKPEYLQNNIEARTQGIIMPPQETSNSSKTSPKMQPPYRFQQPEPASPEGIRFQLTGKNFTSAISD